MTSAKYRRILLKISGEILAGEQGYGIEPAVLDNLADEIAAVVDVLQTPALLCRQTDFIVAVASRGKPVNLKKGQFLAPWEMQSVVDKAPGRAFV